MKLIDGKILAQKHLNEIKNRIQKDQLSPGLAIVLVGDDPSSHLYVRIKERACQQVGVRFEKHFLPADALEEQVVGLIEELNARSDIHGIVVQLPLPKHLNEDDIIEAINPLKDADGFHPDNLARLAEGKPTIMPALTLSIMDLIEHTDLTLSDRLAVVIANSRVFYEPQSIVLRRAGLETEFVGADLKNPLIAEADIIIIAIGQPAALKASQVKDGTVIIDVGITKTASGVVGDVDRQSFNDKDCWLTPVPGGVGPMTVAHLLHNTLLAAVQ